MANRVQQFTASGIAYNPNITVGGTSQAVKLQAVAIKSLVWGGTVACVANIYDGIDNTGLKRYTLRAAAGTSQGMNVDAPMFQNGIYVEIVSAATTEVTVEWGN